MNRTEQIILQTLAVLNAMPDGQCAESILKASVDLLIKPNSLQSEFEQAIAEAEKQKLILGVRSRFRGIKWSITDSGRAEHLQNSR